MVLFSSSKRELSVGKSFVHFHFKSSKEDAVKGTITVVAALMLLILTACATPQSGQQPAPTVTDITSCEPVDGYSVVANVMATNANGENIYIARALVSYGVATAGGKSVVIPPCGSPDPALVNISGVFIYVDGKLAYVANGAIGGMNPAFSATPVPATAP